MVNVHVYTVYSSDDSDDQSPDPEDQSTTGTPARSDEADGEEQHSIRNRSGSELASTQDDDYINTSVGVASDHLGGDQSEQKVLPSSSSWLLAKDVKTKKKKKKGEKQKTEKKKGDNQKKEKKKKGNINYDSENELWIGLEQGISTQENEPKRSIEKKNKKRIKEIKKFRHKSEWESSVKGDGTAKEFRQLNDDSDIEFARTSTTSLVSLGSSKGEPSFTFRSLKELRSSTINHSMAVTDSGDASMSNSVSSEASDHKSSSSTRYLLRKDLEAQARARVEKSFRISESGNLSAVFDGFQRSLEINNVEEEDEKMNDLEEFDGDGEEEDGKHKTGRLQKWPACRKKAFTRKGYIMLASFCIFLFVIANIVLIVILAS
jgi:hypothetical protein